MKKQFKKYNQNDTEQKVFRRRIFQDWWVRALAVLASVVVFCTVYALILPATAVSVEDATTEEGFYLEASPDEAVPDQVPAERTDENFDADESDALAAGIAGSDEGTSMDIKVDGEDSSAQEGDPFVGNENVEEAEEIEEDLEDQDQEDQDQEDQDQGDQDQGDQDQEDQGGLTEEPFTEPEEEAVLPEEEIIDIEVDGEDGDFSEEDPFREMICSGSDFDLAMIFHKDQNIPETASLDFYEVQPETAAFKANYRAAAAAAAAQGQAISAVRFFNISLYDGGKEIQLPENTHFEIRFSREQNPGQGRQPQVIRLDNDKSEYTYCNTEIITESNQETEDASGEQAAHETHTTVGFETDATGLFAFATTEQSTARELTALEKSDYYISAAFDASAGIPSGASLQVREILPGTSEYNVCMSGAQIAVEDHKNANGEISYARFFDFSLLNSAGQELAPVGPVSFSIFFTKESGIEIAENGSANKVFAVHFDGTDNKINLIRTQTECVESVVSAVWFDADSVSFTGVIYTGEAGQKEAEPAAGTAALSESEASEEENEALEETDSEASEKDTESLEETDSEASEEETEALEETDSEASAVETESTEDSTVKELVYADEDFDLAVIFDENASIPATAELQLIGQIMEDAEFKTTYAKATAEAAALNKAVAAIRFFTIKIVDGEDEIVLPKNVSFEIRYHEDKTSAEGRELEVAALENGLFAFITTEESAAGQLAASELNSYNITMDYDANAGIPSDASLSVREILPGTDEYDSYLNGAKTAVEDNETTTGEVSYARFFDITILNAAGQEITPAAPVSVNITFPEKEAIELSEKESAADEVLAVHFDEENDHIDLIETETNGTEYLVSDVSFEAGTFSVYGVIYTVDFHYEVNGKMHEFSIPGGGYVTLQQLAELLGIPGDTNSSENAVDDVAEIDAEADEAEADETDSEAAPLTLEDVVVSEETRKFVAEVASVEFSDPELVWVGKVENDSTVGGLKETNGLACEYSAEVTEEQIVEINSSTVGAGDWALISVQPFDTEESLTVTMKNGDQFVVRVTDAQISTNILTADGLSFCITVTYDKSAEIPEGTVLQAEEIEPGTDEYLQYLGRTWDEVNRAYSEPKIQGDDTSEAPYINVNAARFFDIKLVYNGAEIEPKAPVQVEITYTDGLASWDNTKPGVVHFTKENGIELLDEVQTGVEDNTTVSFRYEQDSFSVIGTYIQQETHNAETPPLGAQYTFSNSGVFARKAGSDNPVKNGGEEDSAALSITTVPADLLTSGGTEKPDTEDNSALSKPHGEKTLDPNDDGTYTLTLSVKGSSQTKIKKVEKKANVLFVMDRSSSMITNTVSDDEQFWYYGTQDTAEFRGDIIPANGYQFYGEINGEIVPLNATVLDWRQGGDGWSTFQFTYNGAEYSHSAPLYVKSKTTRLYAEQAALDSLIGRLLAHNVETADDVEIAVISFADHRSDTKGWTDTEHSSWVQGTDKSALMDCINNTRYASGTNWEEALKYAYDVISAKKTAESNKPEEDYYVVFLTDGEPTNIVGDTSAAQHTGDAGNKDAYDAAKDDALVLVQNGYKFYNIFTYRKNEPVKYSKYLTNYAYSNGASDYNDTNTDAVNMYFSDARTIDDLENTFNNIFLTIADVIGHANVSITDTLTTDAMTTTIVQGKTNGYVYTVKDPSGAVLYTVTATGDIDNPTVTFNVPASATKTYTASPSDVGGKTLYSVTTAEGDEYRIALADVNSTTGELTWDLSPVGILMDDCTYSISFVVWPDQEAYDYVAGLNNGLTGYTWDTSSENEAYQDLTDTKGYAIGGVSRFPSIVKYPDGTFAVLTNTDQKVHYSVVEMETVNGEPNGDPTVHGPYYQDLETPDPMELTATETKLQKVWGIERNPSTLAQLLYDDEGNPTQFQINYGIKILDQGETGTDSEGSGSGQEDPDEEQDESSYYTTLTLGWDGTKYDWDPNSVRYVSLNGNSGPSVPVGTSWSKDFAIATGLMLSEARMDALGLDKDTYGPPYSYGSTNYYILETGHDYTIEEIIPEDAPRDAYEFDFDAPTYHPMLVDGKLKSVVFDRDAENNVIISIKEISKEDWLLSLKIENTLRGYIKLEKNIVDKDGRTPLPEDDTEFEYEINIEDPASIGRFTGTHIPWYGVDGLFYHNIDEEGNYHYFQAETNTNDNKAHEFTLTTESGEECPAVCIDEAAGGIFDEDVAGPTLIQYVENGETKQISLYGNLMEHIDDNHVRAVMKINQYQVLDIANVPTKSTYTIKEVNQEGYNLVNVRREIRNNNIVESGNTYTGSTIVSGKIVADRDNHIIYTNKIYSVDLTVKKTDENDMPLTGAVFSLYKKDGDSWPDEPMAAAPDEDEEDTAVYEFINLKDGSYKLVETPPAGYDAVDDVFFTVTNGVLSIDGSLPAGVTKDEEKLLLTVKNSPRTDSLTVRKQWLDYNGNPREPGANEVGITLKRRVDVPKMKKLHVIVRVRNSANNGYRTKIDEYWDITNESAIVSWYDNRQYNYENGRMSIEASTGLEYASQVGTNINRAMFTISKLTNASDAPTITFSYTRSNESWIYDQINDYSIEGSGPQVTLGGDPVEDNWSQTITLNDANDWSSTMTNLPANDGNGNAYHYYIVEESVPMGYTVSYSDDNATGITTGVLTAYNKKTTEDVDVTVRKVWEDGSNEDGTPTTHQENLVVTLSNGQRVTLNEENHWEATITDLPKYDEEGNEIAYSWTEEELANGYYLSDSNTVIYDNSVTTTLTNSYSEHYMPEMEIDGVKIWDDDGTETRPSSITVKLYKDNVLYKTTTVTPPTGENVDPDSWTFKFTNLPIFNTDADGNATGTLAVYTVEEVLPAGYTSDYEITIQQVQATYEAGTAEAHIINSFSRENQLVSEGADLGFVIVRHGQGYVVWTPRPLRDGELDKIKHAADDASHQFKGILTASGDNLTIISGAPRTVKVGSKEAATVYMKDGDVWVRFENPSAESDIVYGSIPYTYTQIGGEGGVTITNVRKTTSISGTKTWVDGGRQHNNAEEITLKLYRTNKPVTDDSQWEEVKLTATGTISLSWDGNTYTYSNLPRYADYTSNPPVEYEYRVEETAVNVTEGMGAGQHTISYKMESDGNNFINTELINIEATKTWKDAGVSVNATLTNASVTFELQKKVGDNWIKVVQEGVTNPQTMSVTETADANAWKAVWNDLPKYEQKTEDGQTQVVAIEYRVVETAASVSGQDVKPDTDPSAAVSAGGKANIDNILQITINILKVDADDDTIKLGNAEFELTKVQSLDTTNQVTEHPYCEQGTTSDADDDTKGMLQFTGITPGYYYLRETKTPDGYILTTTNGWHFQVDESGIVQDAGDFTDDGTFRYVDAKSVTIGNTSGSALPEAGGPGTKVLYLLGIALISFAGAGFMMKRRSRKTL